MSNFKPGDLVVFGSADGKTVGNDHVPPPKPMIITCTDLNDAWCLWHNSKTEDYRQFRISLKNLVKYKPAN